MSPQITTNAGLSIYPFGFTRGGGASGWIGVFSANILTGSGLTFDTSGNVWAGYGYVTNGQVGRYYSISPSGVLNGSKYTVYGGSPTTGIASSIQLDSSNNIYLCSWYYAQGGNLVKANSSNTSQWQKFNVYSYGTQWGVALDSSSNVFWVEAGYYGATGRLTIRKYNSAGTSQWERQLSNGNREIAGGCATDSTGAIVVAFTANWNTSPVSAVTKYNSAGTIQWQKTFSQSNYSSPNFNVANYVGQYVAVDGSDNVYVLSGKVNATSTLAYTWITKFNSSGTQQWIRRLESSADGIQPSAVAVTSAGDVYLATNEYTLGTDSSFIIKYDTSGTLQWKLKVSKSGDYVRINRIIANSDFAYFSGSTTAASNIFKLPAAGTITGTFIAGTETFTIANATTVTSTTPADSYSNSALTDGAASAISGAFSSTLSTTSETLTTKVIP